MLFDLRSRRRRTAVRIIYILLAFLMAAGLLLVGVGTGNNNGGLLDIGGNGGSGELASDPLVQQQLATALKQTKQNPQSSAAWLALMQARLQQAQSGGNYNSSTGIYNAEAQTHLRAGVDAWNQYLRVVDDKPSLTGASLAKAIYHGLQDYGGMATAYQFIVKREPKLTGAFTCLALSSYAAGHTQLGDLASAKAVSLTPSLQRLTLKSSLQQAGKTPATAKQYALAEC